MAATERGAGALLAAALALPGILPLSVAKAQTPPETGLIQLKYLDYRDWQTGADRMRVESPSLYVLAPLSETLSLEASLVYDGMSGASPTRHNTLSGASGLGVTDYRTAGDVKFTKYYERFAVGVGAAYSHERDYISRAGMVDLRVWTEDKNRTWAFGFSGAADRIHTENAAAQREQKHVLDFLVGVTQVLDATTIVQSNLTYMRGHGYFDDPYKQADRRPDYRRMLAWLTRINRHFPEPDGTLRLAYRYIDDSFGADSHMFELAWTQSLPQGWSVTPTLRYYTQSAAFFYYDPPFPQGLVLGQPYTADTRLSAFGAVTAGVKVVKQFDDGWSADLKVDFYRQRSSWRAGGNGSPGLLPFSARWIMVGIGKTF